MIMVRPSEDVVAQGDSECRFGDRGGGAVAHEIRKAGQARGMKDSMYSMS